MYPEFIAIYVGLGILFLMLFIVLIMLIVLLKRTSRVFSSVCSKKSSSSKSQATNLGGITFCRHCGCRLDAIQSVCPQCGTRR